VKGVGTYAPLGEFEDVGPNGETVPMVHYQFTPEKGGDPVEHQMTADRFKKMQNRGIPQNPIQAPEPKRGRPAGTPPPPVIIGSGPAEDPAVAAALAEGIPQENVAQYLKNKARLAEIERMQAAK